MADVQWILFRAVLGALVLPAAFAQEARILDLSFHSKVFAEERNYRVFLPPDYEQSGKRYPVVYFFHGHGERHNRPPRGNPGYDSGTDYGGDTIAAFVGRNDLIVVKWDGTNPRKPGEDYVRPYNISPVETDRQFPLYFPELVAHIDSRFRTIADREHRATAGLSMGGFMSFWISGKYPQLVGSASNFMGSPEFDGGPKEFPTEYCHSDMYRNYEGMRTRIVMGSRDFIRWYHRRMNLIWDFTRPHHEHEEFDSAHGTPGMAKTLAFHMNAFRNPLPKPALWHHADLYPDFDVWGWRVASDRRTPGFTVLENVSRSGFRSSAREWVPGGRLLSEVTLRVITEALYRPRRPYSVTDVNLDTAQVRRSRQVADSDGRLHFELSGHRHEVGIDESARPVLTVADSVVAGAPWATPGKSVRLNIALLNKGARQARSIRAVVSSPAPGVRFERDTLTLASLGAGRRAEAGEITFVVDDPRREIVRLNVRITDASGAPAEVPVDVPLFADVPALAGFKILDGAKAKLWERAVKPAEKILGAGNGDGVVQAGETIAVAVPDGEAYRAVELFTSDACALLTRRLSDPWGAYDNVGATAKITLARISPSCPEGHEIPFFARWIEPNKPEHVLKQGVVRVRVTGR
jgi:S-formylglutathione hydrolase FrmB